MKVIYTVLLTLAALLGSATTGDTTAGCHGGAGIFSRAHARKADRFQRRADYHGARHDAIMARRMGPVAPQYAPKAEAPKK